MATTTKRIRVTELDFTEIKNNLKLYLKSQPKFADYNFEGSAMNTLLDVLAYNTHYNAVYSNMVANEMFLDSAVKRDSIVSLAKHLGYTPRSSTAPSAVINVTINSPAGSPATLTMPSGTTFSTQVNGTSFSYVTQSDLTIVPSSGVYTFTNVNVKEGTSIRYEYTKNSADTNQRFLIQDDRADTSTLKVSVQNSTTDATVTTFTRAENILDIKDTSEVYFLNAVEDGQYEITFGDGVLGKALSDGNIVVLEYLITNEDTSNGAKTFTLSSTVGGTTNATVTTVSNSQGGAIREGLDSIKFNAPKYYSSQNRAVTAEDFKVILPQLYGNVDSMQVWGGEDNDPPIYGKVFLSIKPVTGTTLTETTKASITKDILSSKVMVSITPEIVDPLYICIMPTINVYWNPNSTTSTAGDISTRVKAAVSNYYDTEIKNFDSVFRFSKFSKIIDEADIGITSNITTFRIEQHFTAVLNEKFKYTTNFYNPLFTQGAGAPTNLSSTGFYLTGSTNLHFLDDDGAGNVRSYYLEQGTSTRVYTNSQQGTINYKTGQIIVDQLSVTSTVLDNNEVKIYVTPNSNDVVSVRNVLLMINPANVVVNTIVDKVATGESTAGVDYTVSSSHNLSQTGQTTTTSTSISSAGSTSSSSSSSSSSGSSSSGSSGSSGY